MDKKEIIDIKGLPVYLQADVVVCGGGTAGVFAAVAAAKEGASVLLVEALGGLWGQCSERACAANDECAHEGRTQMFLSASGYDEASGSISAGQNQ